MGEDEAAINLPGIGNANPDYALHLVCLLGTNPDIFFKGIAAPPSTSSDLLIWASDKLLPARKEAAPILKLCPLYFDPSSLQNERHRCSCQIPTAAPETDLADKTKGQDDDPFFLYILSLLEQPRYLLVHD